MISVQMYDKLRKSLVLHEGYKNFPYTDTVGKITIGIGYNLTDRGLDDDWINTQYLNDVNYFYDKFSSTFVWFDHLNTDRQIILIDMAFMGWQRFLEFGKLIVALSTYDYLRAAHEMLNSKWAIQTRARAARLAEAMETGVYNL